MGQNKDAAGKTRSTEPSEMGPLHDAANATDRAAQNTGSAHPPRTLSSEPDTATTSDKLSTKRLKDTPQSLADGIAVIKKCLKTAPEAPGVYRMLSADGDVLYVGKAKHIKRRVTSYTQENRLTNRHMRMVRSTADMLFVTTRTEAEALLLEASLIKRFKPPFNVLLKDDKSFPYILLREDHIWPQITKHRGARKHKGRYYGPFASVSSVNQTLNTLQKVFQLRSCTDTELETRTRACLLHQIKRCSAPCVGKVTAADYKDMVHETAAFLEGRTSHIQKKFAAAMQEAASEMNYEVAAVYRDRLAALTHIQSHQAMVNAMVDEADVIGAANIGGQVGIQIFFFRAGQNWGHRAYFPRHEKDAETEDVLASFITQFYDNKPAPKLILTSHALPEQALIIEALSERMERRVEISVPKRGKKLEAVSEAVRNARESLERKLAEDASQTRLLAGVADLFDLPGGSPNRIEVYDNSHIQGSHALGAMVVAGPDGFMKNSYRTFNIKDLPDDVVAKGQARLGGDDFAMMREVMHRRFARLLKEDPKRTRGMWPDLVLIDGGKGQLSSVMEALSDLKINDVTLVAISKGPDRNAGREQFHMPGRESFMLPEGDAVLYYLQRLRDEAHRFAIGTHRAKRSRAIPKSPLDEIEGIGPKRKKALLHHFGSAKAVAGADVRDIEAVEGISKATAQQIYDFFHG